MGIDVAIGAMLSTRFLSNASGPPPNHQLAPENQWLENEMSFWDGLFSGAMLVQGG